MLRGLLRFLAYSLAFWFVYRVIVGAFRQITREASKGQAGEQPTRRETKSDEPPDYHDIKEARFKDIPGDSSKPS